MKIVDIPIEQLKPFARNNKQHSAKQVEMIANSIKEFWFRNPIIIDKNKEIIAGHWRLLWAQQLGIEKVPCIMADDLTDKQVRAYRLLDNRIADFAQYDIENVALELQDIWDLQLGLETLDSIFDGVIVKDVFNEDLSLPDWDKGTIETMTFTLHIDQKDCILKAIDLADTMGVYDQTKNKNANWNALERICNFFLERWA